MKRATTGELQAASPLVRALREAYQTFGPANDENVDYIARWVQRRVQEMTAPRTSEPFDAKLTAAQGDAE